MAEGRRFRRDFDASTLDRDTLLAIVRSGCVHSVHHNGCHSCEAHADLLEERAARRQAQARVEEVERERDLAIAHDRQPYPTADAYEKVCAARTKWQDRAQKAEQTIAEVREELERMATAFEERAVAALDHLHRAGGDDG